MKLIHCADWHLDSPMEANLSGLRPAERARELRDTFFRMVRYAHEEGVSAILIAGDLFDSPRAPRGTRRFFLETVAAHPAIRFFYLRGNHDRGLSFGAEELPQNLYLFGDEWRTYDLGEVTVTGSEAPDPAALSLDPLRCNLLLLHGAAGDHSCPLAVNAFRGKLADYLALGHLHAYRTLPSDARGTAVYCGCPEGRGFDECGECGFVLLEVEGRTVSHRFVPFAKRTIYSVTADVSKALTYAELEECVLDAVEGVEPTALLRVLLCGARRGDVAMDVSALERMLCERFYFAAVRDETHLALSPEDYENDVSLRGAFVRSVLASDLSPEERERVIACGLRALAGEELLL